MMIMNNKEYQCRRKNKILFVVEAMGGGVFTYIVDLANLLINDFDIYIAYAVRKQTPINFAEYFDERIHLIKVEHFTRKLGINDFKAFFEIKKIANQIHPDIIHLHSSKAGVLGRWAFDGKKTPMFYTPHGYSFLMNSHGRVKRIFYKCIEKISGKRICTTISCSEGEYQEAMKVTRDVVCINNGINIDHLQKIIDETERTEHEFTVFTLGRICNQKNPKLFNEIAMALPKVKFVWIGDGELKNQLTSTNIIVTGWVSRDRAIKYAINADVFLLPSLWEGLPISLLEAMFMEKLCVVSDIIGNRDVIQNGFNGYVCNNIYEYVEGIKGELLLGKQARKDVEKKYNTVVMSERYKEIYLSKLEDFYNNKIKDDGYA